MSYSPAIYFVKTQYLLRSVGLQFDHLAVFLDIADIHDDAVTYAVRDDSVIRIEAPTLAIKDFLYEYTTLPRNIWQTSSKLYTRLSDAPGAHRTPEERRYAINDYVSLWTIDDTAYAAYGERGLAKSKEHMDQLHDLLQRHGIGMTLAVFPWPDQVFHGDLDSIQVKFWREWAENHSVHFINLFPEFVGTSSDPKEIIAQSYIPGDCHWNEHGHRLVARRFLAEWANLADGFNVRKKDQAPT